MLLTYVGPHDEVEIDGVGVVRRGEDLDVPPEVAGRAPSLETVPRAVVTAAGILLGRRAEDITVPLLAMLADTDDEDHDADVLERALAQAQADAEGDDVETVEVLDPGEGLLAQPDNFVPAKDGLGGLKKAELEAIALERGVDLTGTKTNADRAERIRAAAETQEV